MATDRPRTGSSWVGAAQALARRVNRRAQLTAATRRLGWVLLGAGLLAVAWRAFGGAGADDTRIVLGILGAGFLVGLLPALRAARRAPRVSDADAAWALDRLADARGRGLAAAAATGPAASEAAFADGGLTAPPTVRLLPPHGLLPVIGAVLLGAVALLAPARTAALPPEVTGVAGTGGTGGGDAPEDGPSAAAEALAAETEARSLDEQAAGAERVREALNLPPDGPLDPEEVADRLADAERRRAAADAAEPGTALRALLGEDDVSGDALARLLAAEEDNRALASERRRAAAGARAARERLAVPPDRRAVVERYLLSIR